MKLRHLAAVALVAAVSLGQPLSDGSDLVGEVDASAGAGAIELNEAASAERSGGASRAPAPDPELTEYLRTDLCNPPSPTMPGLCSIQYGLTHAPLCDDGQGLVPPLWVRTRASVTEPWSQWDPVSDWSCRADAPAVMTQADFRRLPIAPLVVHVQPDRPEVLVNKPTIVYTDPTTQTFTPTLLGQVIEVQATPTTYTWDFGDHTDPITTTSPGHPYPDQDTTHPYRSLGTYTITLTTTWTGHYRPAGTTTWLPVTGTATTTTTTGPITTVEAPTHLVSTNCHHTPHAPNC